MNKEGYLSLSVSTHCNETCKDHAILSKIMDKNWKIIRDFCLNSREQIRSWQFERIKKLVKHAFDTVPLYKRKYSIVGFNPNDLKTWKDFEALPILTKEELIDAFPDGSVSSLHTLDYTTRSSGSSGKFVTIAVSQQAIYIDTIQGIRQYYFQNGKKYKKTDIAMHVAEVGWWIESINGFYATQWCDNTKPLNTVTDSIEKTRPKILSMYPTYLQKLRNAEVDLKSFDVDLVIVNSEQSSPALRHELARYFGINVLDEFSSEELTRIALECPFHNYHLEEDACYVEIVDEKTYKVLPNESRGLLIGTNLLNEATPIIRYYQGDVASIRSDTKCDCGSNFRMMNSPEGRFIDSIALPNGDYIPSSLILSTVYLWHTRRGIPVHGLRYQIVQDKNFNITIYITKGAFNITLENIKGIRNLMYELIPETIKIDVKMVDDVPYTQTKKFRAIISFIKHCEPRKGE
jgi:phenylacetate-CoA ligase